jgi:hypothetical protein
LELRYRFHCLRGCGLRALRPCRRGWPTRRVVS